MKRKGIGAWGNSHGQSYAITGQAAAQMGIPGYKVTETDAAYRKMADYFLTEIAKDTTGSEEILRHSFENMAGTVFKVGDTLQLPVLAAAGDVTTGYGKRSDKRDQDGQPVVFEFEVGTQMAAYSGMSLYDARDGGYKSIDEANRDRGHIWDEALVAGAFEVVSVTTAYMGSQHNSGPERPNSSIDQLFGQVVRLRQIKTYDPATKTWIARG
jgi:hypothetical protein